MIDENLLNEINKKIFEIDTNMNNILKTLKEIDSIIKDIKEISNDIDKLLPLQIFTSDIDLISVYLKILHYGFALGYVASGQIPIEITLQPNETVYFYAVFPDGYAGVVPYVEMDSSTENCYITVTFNPEEYMEDKQVKVEIPSYFVDVSTTVNEYKIPITRTIRYLPLVPVWYINIKLENRSTTESSDVYVTFPFIQYPEKMLSNLYFNILDRIYNVLEQLALNRMRIEDAISNVFKVKR